MDKPIKSGTGEMRDDKVIIPDMFQENEYLNIEKKVTPEIFYDFLSLKKGDVFENNSCTIKLNVVHYALMERLRTQVLKAKVADMVRGLTGLGIVAHARLRNIATKNIKVLVSLNHIGRKQEIRKRFEQSMSRLDFDNDYTREVVIDTVKKHGNNEYGKALWSKLHNAWNMPEIKFDSTGSDLNLSPDLLAICRKMTKKPLTNDMFRLKKITTQDEDAVNVSVNITLSNRFLIIMEHYTKLFFSGKLRGQMLRGFLITGLHIFAKWTIKEKINKEEYDLGRLINAIDNAAACQP